jgi:predicted dehydrogenase
VGSLQLDLHDGLILRTPVTIGVVGLGPWGIRLAHVFRESPRAELRWVCDQRLVTAQVPGAPAFTLEIDDLLSDESVDAVALATPPATRYALATRALEAGKHVYVEGPPALTVSEAQELLRLAAARDLRLMVGHALLFHPGVRKLKELTELGRLGEVYYLTCAIAAPPRSKGNEGVLSSLAGDAVAATIYLLGDEPVETWATAESYVDPTAFEVAAASMRFATGIAATLHLSQLDAREQCLLAVVGSRRTGVFEAHRPDRPVTIYERVSPRGAETISPRVAREDSLRLQCETFLAGIHSRLQFPSTQLAPAVVRVLEALAGRAATPVTHVNSRAARARLRLAAPPPALREGASLSTKQR